MKLVVKVSTLTDSNKPVVLYTKHIPIKMATTLNDCNAMAQEVAEAFIQRNSIKEWPSFVFTTIVIV